jgi:hypothetical protein
LPALIIKHCPRKRIEGLDYIYYTKDLAMAPTAYISQQPAERREILKNIHDIIMAHDSTITATVEPMMGKEMIIYKANGMMKYGLAGVKNYMSLHPMPMYASPKIYSTYKALLSRANFQKGCINFAGSADIQLPVVQQLIIDCAAVDLFKIKNDYLQAKKAAKRK